MLNLKHMKNNPHNDIRGAAALAAAVLLLLPAAMLFFSSAKLHYPTAQWDGWALDSMLAIRAGTFADKPYITHPPLYLYLLALFKPLFRGDLLEGARLFNFACYLLSGWLTFILSAGLAEKYPARAAGLIAAALYFLSPLAVQGIFLLDLGDTGPVPVAAAAYFCLSAYRPGGLLSGLALAVCFALNLWAKFIHSFFLVLAAILALVTDEEGSRARGTVKILASGAALFLLSWAVYAFTSLHRPDRWGPFDYFINEMFLNYQRQDLQAGIAKLFFTRTTALIRVALWIWPLLVLWAWRLYKRGFGSGAEKCLNYFILVFMAGAWMSKGTSNGFPKYHAALLPGLCALCGAYLAEFLPELKRALTLPRAALAAAAFLFIYVAGDPLFTFNCALKKALIRGAGVNQEVGLLVLQLIAAPAIILVLFRSLRAAAGKTAAVAISLAAAGFIWQLALHTHQARGEYFTTYGYGTTGKSAAVEYVKGNFKAGTSSGPNEFAWELKAAGVPFAELSDACFINRECTLGVLRDKGTSFFIFGQASNTVEQVRYFLSLDPQALGRPFALVKKGDFWIYDFNPRPD